ncbi:MAG TPA: DUF6455 family protein [Burkholderiales bacterium]|nr:DUF6455 family protein [Burkholderiales bacterium]
MNATLAALALLAALLGAIAIFAIIAGRRLLEDRGPLRLRRMLERRGADAEQVLGTGSYAAAVATRRCVACRDQAACDAWLASGRREGAAEFCPNAAFVETAARERA